MALNKKLIVLSGVGLVFAGVGAGVIGYKASQVAEGQKQMDDSNASMGGQLSFGLASPLAGFAADQGAMATNFVSDMQAKFKAAGVKGSYVNISDQAQGDLITAIAHSTLVANPKAATDPAHPLIPASTDKGDAQSALAKILTGLGIPSAVMQDNEINDLRASDVRRIVNGNITKERAAKLNIDPAKISKQISGATLVSLNVGMEDILEAAIPTGESLTDYIHGVQMKAVTEAMTAKKTPTEMTALVSKAVQDAVGTILTNLGSKPEVMTAVLNAVGDINGAISSIRRINPQALIILGTVKTFDNTAKNPLIEALNSKLGTINMALQMVGLTQDVKDAKVTVLPVDPNATLPPISASLASIYTTESAATTGSKDYTDLQNAFNALMAGKLAQAQGAVTQFEATVKDPATRKAIYGDAQDVISKAMKIQAWMASDAGKAALAAAKPSTATKAVVK